MPEVLINGKNKTQIVREVLEQLGFMQEDVPSNWKTRVQNALARQKVTVHETVIYQTRRQQLTTQARLAAQEAAKTPPPVVAPEPVVAVVAPTPEPEVNVFAKLTLADAKELKAVAAKFGGFKGLIEAVKAVESLTE